MGRMNRPKLRAFVRRVVLWGGGFAGLLLLFVLVSNLWVVRYAQGYVHERPYQPSTENAAETVAIVPGAAVRGMRPSPVLQDRLQTALELYESGTVSRILVSGDHGRPHYDEVGAMQHWLLAQGVASQDIVLDHAGFRTLDTMIRAREVFGIQRAIVCTQRFHLDRSVFLARRAGIDAHGVVADRLRYRGHRWNQIREALARPAAVLDTYVLRRRPKFL